MACLCDFVNLKSSAAYVASNLRNYEDNSNVNSSHSLVILFFRVKKGKRFMEHIAANSAKSKPAQDTAMLRCLY